MTPRVNEQALSLPFECLRSMPGGINEVRLWHDSLLDCERVGKRIDRLALDSSIVPEASTLQRIDHTNVVPVVAAAFVGGYPPPMDVVEIITPYFPMGSVTDYLLAGGRLSFTDSVSVVRSAARGLEELHEVHNLCHRDIKSGNILLASTSDGLVADLGLAGLMDSNGQVPTLPNPTLYSPPELRSGYVGRAGDLFSLALVFRELIGGHFPYAAYSRTDVVDRLAAGSFALRDDDLRLPVWAGSLTRRFYAKAINKDPARRFQSARAFEAALARLPLTDWVEVAQNSWAHRRGGKQVEVEASPTRGGLRMSVRIDRGRGPRRAYPDTLVSGLDSPEALRVFDSAGSL